MSLLKTNEIQNYNGSSLTLTASTVSTSAQLNTGGNISVTGSLNVSDDSTTRTNLGLGTIATQDSSNVNLTGGTIGSSVVFPALGNSAVGTVSQSSGTPTGDIIERGSNANGEYVKFADGTMICTLTFTGIGPINSSSGSGYYASAGSYSTSATFIAVPTVTGTSFNSSATTTSIISGSSNPSTTSFGSFFLWRFTSDSSTSFEINLMAIGRWY